jgi:WD40 repeat protein/serine/threonine protein kinase
MSRCPSPTQLEELPAERLPAADARWVAAHVEACPACQAALERFTESPRIGRLSAPVARAPADSSAPQVTQERVFLERLKDPSVLASLSGTRPRAADPTGAGAGAGSKAARKFPRVSGYEIRAELGRGGMGVVYLATQSGLNRAVALKMILAGPHANQKHLDRFRQEAEAVARLHHPNIVQIYDIGEADGVPYFALEYVEEGNLDRRIRGEPQELAAASRLVETLARTVHFAHQRGIVHRDLKPANILLQVESQREVESRKVEEGVGGSGEGRQAAAGGSGPADFTTLRLSDFRPKITDFGLAKRLDEHGARTQSGEIVGTPSYMAPEQAGTEPQRIGPATDVYALGAILYELLTGRPPFKGPNPLETVLQVLHEEPVRPSHLRPGLPRDLETICLKCLQKNPAHRYPSAAELADDLRRFRTGAPIRARPVGPVERVWKAARRRPVIAALLVGMCGSAVLGFAGVTWQWHRASRALDQVTEARDVTERTLTEKEQALYYSRISRSQLQWRLSDVRGAVRSLMECRPQPARSDPRGWEWFFLLGLFQSDLFTFQHDSSGGGNAAFHPDGRSVVSLVGGHDTDDDLHRGAITIWDTAAGARKNAFRVPGTAHRLVLNSDGTRIALATTDGSVLVLDTATGTELVRTPPDEQFIAGLAFSPDGTLLARASWDQTVKVCDAATGAVRHVLSGHAGRVQCVAFHPDGTTLASGDTEAVVKLWDVRTGTERSTLRGHKSPVYGVAFSPDGALLATGGSNGNLKFWELSTGKVIQSLTGRSGAVLDSCFSPDGRYLAYCGGDGTVRVWDVESGIERFIFRGHSAPVESVRFSPDGARLVSSSPSEGTVKVWDLTRHPEHATFARVRAREDERVKVRDLTGRADAALLARTGPDLEALAFHADGKHLVSVAVGGNLQIWDAATGVLEQQRALPTSDELVSPAVLAAFSPDGARLCARAREDARTIKVWDVMTGAERAIFRGHTLPVTCVRFSADGHRLVSAACDPGHTGRPHEIKVWEAATGACLATRAGTGLLFNVAFSPDGRLVAAGGQDGLVLLADWAAKRGAVRLTGHASHVPAVAFSADGRLFATVGIDKTLLIFDLVGFEPASGAQPKGARTFSGAPPFVCDLAFSPDGRRLAGISREVVKLWDVGTGHEVITLRGAAQRNWDPVFNPRVLFGPDGKRLVGTNWDESISVWDAGTTDDPADPDRQRAVRRTAADGRAVSWHLDEAETCLDHHNRSAAQYHLRLLGDRPLPTPLHVRRERLAAQLSALNEKRDGAAEPKEKRNPDQ